MRLIDLPSVDSVSGSGEDPEERTAEPCENNHTALYTLVALSVIWVVATIVFVARKLVKTHKRRGSYTVENDEVEDVSEYVDVHLTTLRRRNNEEFRTAHIIEESYL